MLPDEIAAEALEAMRDGRRVVVITDNARDNRDTFLALRAHIRDGEGSHATNGDQMIYEAHGAGRIRFGAATAKHFLRGISADLIIINTLPDPALRHMADISIASSPVGKVRLVVPA